MMNLQPVSPPAAPAAPALTGQPPGLPASTASTVGPDDRAASPLVFCCPQCKGPLRTEPADQPEWPERYRCAACARDYPVVLGIPDFRVYPDPYIEYGADHAKARLLAADAGSRTFAQLVQRYWELTPDVPPQLARRYIRHVLNGVASGRASLAAIRRAAAGLGSVARPQHTFLEVGCGTGGALIAAAQQYEHVAGIDIAFRWLVLARKRVDEAVQLGQLTPEQAARIKIVCACAEYLPFPDHSLDVALAYGVIEHTARQEELLRQTQRALRPGGVLFLATPNRYSLTPEPHVRVWGVGFLPRTWMSRYVRAVRGIAYEHIRLLSLFDLNRLLRKAGFVRWQVFLPRLSDGELRRYSALEQWGIALYHRLIGLPGSRHALYLFGPLFHAVAVAPESVA